jgi:hypothetical protein
MHSVSRTFTNSITTGFSAFGFSFSDTNSISIEHTSQTTHTMSHEVSQSKTFSDTFIQKCPPSTDPSLKNNPGYGKGVAMWQWVFRGAYETLMTEPMPWATFHTHHVVCSYGNVPRSYGPKPQCMPTYCEGSADSNCERCSSYEWDPKNESVAAAHAGRSVQSKQGAAPLASGHTGADFVADAGAGVTSDGTASDSTTHSSSHLSAVWIFLCVAGALCAVAIGAMVAVYSYKHHQTSQAKKSIDADTLKETLIESDTTGNTSEYHAMPGLDTTNMTQRCVPMTTSPSPADEGLNV